MAVREDDARLIAWAAGLSDPLSAARAASPLVGVGRWLERYADDPRGALELSEEGRRFEVDVAARWKRLEDSRADLLLLCSCEGGFDAIELERAADGVSLGSLHRLQRQGWLRTEEARSRVPDPVRHLVRQLAPERERHDAERRHAALYLSRAARGDGRGWLARERANLEAIIARRPIVGPESSVRAILSLMPLSRFADAPETLRGQLLEALEVSRSSPQLSAAVRCELAGRLVDFGAFDDALRWADVPADDPAIEARLATLRGHVHVWLERYEEAERHFDEASSSLGAAELEELPRRQLEASLAIQKAFLAMERRDPDVPAVLDAATRVAERAGHDRLVTIGFNLTARHHLAEGRYEEAVRWFSRSRRRHVDEGDPRSVAFNDAMIARAQRLRGDREAAAHAARAAHAFAVDDASDAMELISLIELAELGIEPTAARARIEQLCDVIAIPRLRREGRVLLRRQRSDVVEVGVEGRFVVVGARRIELAKYRAPRLILCCLAEQARRAPERALGVDPLFEAGWPGQTIAGTSRVKRVHTAIWTLRKLGLDGVLQTDEDGYRLDAAVRFV